MLVTTLAPACRLYTRPLCPAGGEKRVRAQKERECERAIDVGGHVCSFDRSSFIKKRVHRKRVQYYRTFCVLPI